MRPITVATLAAMTACAVGCSFMTSRRDSTSGESREPVATHDVSGLAEKGIEAYNNGDIATAKANLEAVLRATREKPMKSTRARAHFYLAAVAWDVGDVRKTDDHLLQCRRLQPLFEPDWTFIAPGLRKHYQNLSVKVGPKAAKPVPEKPVPEKPVPEKPAPPKPASEKPAAEKPAPQKAAETVPPKPAPEKAAPQKATAPAPPPATGGAQKPATQETVQKPAPAPGS
jgi:hypothetical protein